jgi:hypothetical protein
MNTAPTPTLDQHRLPGRNIRADRSPRPAVYSSNFGVCPGSTHPAGLFIRAIDTRPSALFTRPTNSSITFGMFPAALITVGFAISVGMPVLS